MGKKRAVTLVVRGTPDAGEGKEQAESGVCETGRR